MYTPIKLAIISIAAVLLMLIGATVSGNAANAQSVESTPAELLVQAQPKEFLTLEVTPVCADNMSKLAYWKVVNKNADSEVVSWQNFDNGTTGSYVAPAGISQMTTGYDLAAGNNRTGFVWTNNVSSTNSSNTPCEPTQPVDPPIQCIDGRIQQNLTITWLANNKVSVATKDSLPLCDDVTVFFSSYIMPSNYDGNGFYGNTTAYPQTMFSSTSVTLTKGSSGAHELEIALPDSCNNVQVDVYYAPEITTVNADGHGTQNIESKVYLSAGACGNGNGGGQPEEPTTPVTPPITPVTPPVVDEPNGNGAVSAHPPMPAELPMTGAKENMLMTFAPIILGLLTYLSMYYLLPSKRNNAEL